MPVRATVDWFGPLLQAWTMDLNETQESSMQLMFHWAYERGLPWDDLKGLRVEDHPVADLVGDIARTPASPFGRSVAGSTFGTKRRGRRREGLLG